MESNADSSQQPVLYFLPLLRTRIPNVVSVHSVKRFFSVKHAHREPEPVVIRHMTDYCTLGQLSQAGWRKEGLWVVSEGLHDYIALAHDVVSGQTREWMPQILLVSIQRELLGSKEGLLTKCSKVANLWSSSHYPSVFLKLLTWKPGKKHFIGWWSWENTARRAAYHWK